MRRVVTMLIQRTQTIIITSSDVVAVEIVRTLVSSIGLVAGVPLATALAAWLTGGTADKVIDVGAKELKGRRRFSREQRWSRVAALQGGRGQINGRGVEAPFVPRPHAAQMFRLLTQSAERRTLVWYPTSVCSCFAAFGADAEDVGAVPGDAEAAAVGNRVDPPFHLVRFELFDAVA